MSDTTPHAANATDGPVSPSAAPARPLYADAAASSGQWYCTCRVYTAYMPIMIISA